VLITAAPKSRYEEARNRRIQYLVTMGLRAACFIVAVAVTLPPVRIVAVVGAVILPYVAVVGANTVRRVTPDRTPAYYIPAPRPELPAGVGGRGADGEG
jgi:hypothetical protein